MDSTWFLDLSKPLAALLEWLRGLGAPDWLVFASAGLAGALGCLVLVLISQLVMVYLERRLLGRFQIRLGPNRVGPQGTLQVLADGLKGIGKEIILPQGVDLPIYIMGPIIAFLPAFLGFAVLTFGPNMVPINFEVGILYFQAVTSLSALSAFMAGWSSNNKFALFGAMRAVAQFVSYEIPLALSVISVVLVANSMSTLTIANGQFVPYALILPLAFIVFVIGSLAELNRTPMDIMEAESEIVAGYHTEYGGMSFIMFYASEYAHMLSFGAVLNILFFGGWKFFWLDQYFPPWLLFIFKTYLVFFVLIWLRATLPRLRIDQLMDFGWKILVPLALLSIVLTALGLLLTVDGLVGAAVLQWIGLAAIALWQANRTGQREANRRHRIAAARLAAGARP